MEIEVRREALAVFVLLAALIVFGATGYYVSPRGGDGRPVLLMPDVRAVENYRRQAMGWAGQWRALDESLRSVIENSENGSEDLLTVNRTAQKAIEDSVALAREVDGAESPASLIGLRDQAVVAANAYVEASVACARWVSVPSAENKAAADESLAGASRLLSLLEQNEWILKGNDGQ